MKVAHSGSLSLHLLCSCVLVKASSEESDAITNVIKIFLALFRVEVNVPLCYQVT